ncbi:MAG: lysophospholipid acyltransferase family protein [Ignavibacteriaceae bacterium]|jgi:lysophospholipid acyltransferase (LPLAT)-like uncharacterized protein
MKLKAIRRDILRFLGKSFLWIAASVLCKTFRLTFVNKSAIDALEAEGKNYVLAFWHGTMLLPWYFNRKKNFIALVSKSKDGELLAKILKSWGYEVVRGSSSRDGNIVLHNMIDYSKNKRTVALTPDGPRGPIYKMKAGAVITAQKSNIPLVLVGVGIKKKKILKSWDKFEVPAFFSKAKVVYSTPIFFKNDMSYKETSDMITFCEKKLNELQEEAGRSQ